RHLSAAFYSGWHSLHPGGKIGFENGFIVHATARKYVTQFRGKISPFTQQRMTTYTVVLFPDFLAMSDFHREELTVFTLRQDSDGIHRQSDKEQAGRSTSAVVDGAGHAHGTTFTHRLASPRSGKERER